MLCPMRLNSSPYHSEDGSFFIYPNYPYARHMAVVRIAASFFQTKHDQTLADCSVAHLWKVSSFGHQ